MSHEPSWLQWLTKCLALTQDPRDRVHDEHVVGEDMLDFLHAFMEGITPATAAKHVNGRDCLDQRHLSHGELYDVSLRMAHNSLLYADTVSEAAVCTTPQECTLHGWS